MNNLLTCITALIAALWLQSCITDSITTSPADQPEFSVDTLRLGTVFTGVPTPTSRFTVYNRHDDILVLGSVSIRDSEHYRLNVDGTAGHDIGGIEIRPNDSIMVFVEATLPPIGRPGVDKAMTYIDFTVNGVSSSLPVSADACDIVTITAQTVTGKETFTADYPYRIMDSLYVAPGATLTLEAGTRLLFHDGARMRVEGTLLAHGTPTHRVDMTGDRTGFVAAQIPYDIMSGQWGGVTFAPGSKADLAFTVIRNSTDGVRANDADITLASCVLRNASTLPLSVAGCNLAATGCELAEGADGVVAIEGGTTAIDHCTIANYYLFSAISSPALVADADSLSVANSIVYGLGTDIGLPEGTLSPAVTFSRCIFKSKGENDSNFHDCLFDTDPMWLVDRNAYIFDYRLKADSPALNAMTAAESSPATSPDGTDITRHIGAYGASAND